MWIGTFYAWMFEIKGDMGILLDCRKLYFGKRKLAFFCELNLQVEKTACIRTLRCKLNNCLADGLWCFSHAAWGKLHVKNQKKLQVYVPQNPLVPQNASVWIWLAAVQQSILNSTLYGFSYAWRIVGLIQTGIGAM